MNKDIKEILDYFRYIVNDKKETYTVVSKDIIYLEHLLDYITNLQRANKNHSKKIIEMGNKITNLQEIEKDHQKLNGELREENKRLKEYIKIAKVSEWFKGNDELEKLLGDDNE